MYKLIETSQEITMSNSLSIVSPVATLKDEFGGMCQIVEDDHCYVICLKKEDGTFCPTTHVFREAFEILQQLPSPS